MPRKKSDAPIQLSGMTEQYWRTEPEFLEWAQKSEQFRHLLAILINERVAVIDSIPSPLVPVTENRLLGRREGYDQAISLFSRLARGVDKPSKNDYEMTYTQDKLGSEPTD